MSIFDHVLYDASKLCPIYCGYEFEKVGLPEASGLRLENFSEEIISEENDERNRRNLHEIKVFNSSVAHPACNGYVLVKKAELAFKQQKTVEEANTKSRHAQKSIPARVYLEQEILPVLVPALEAMLASAKENNVLKWKRTKFNACDFLTEYLYNNNPAQSGRKQTDLWAIPFVKAIHERKPRPPLPWSLVWSDDKAATVLQACWRGRKVRMDSEVQELRQYQKEMREQEYDVMLKVEDFWKKHPVEEVAEDA